MIRRGRVRGRRGLRAAADAVREHVGPRPGEPPSDGGRPGPSAPEGSLLVGRLRIPPRVTDVILAVLLACIQFVAAYSAGGLEPGLAALSAGTAAAAVLTRLPRTAAVVVGVSVPLYYMTSAADSWAAWLLFVVAVVRLGSTGHRRAAVFAIAALLAVSAVGEVIAFSFWRAVSVLAAALVVLLAGEIARSHRAYVREVQRRAAEAERTREEEGRRRAIEERLRIARELHDVVAHNISLINVQAGAAAHRRDDPEAAFEALDHIKSASRQTLRELRSTLGVLRQVDEGGPPTAPLPSLERVADLVEQTTAAGLPVRLEVAGEPAALPATVDVAAYRIVQEALTNALRHSGAASVRVAVGYDSRRLRVAVADDGSGAPEGSQTAGNGLRGMRERAAAAGGTCTAGPREDGPGFAVRAEFPLPSAAVEGASTTSG
ncbi:sensor histidine kinase [Streptomonospora litoralis]|uniref:histidine kinase n=1 Tax=Streptomonospora litoralis TaxID=2498135 RepID=A0A4P6QA76_9ACTN|nr:histidine kinase [Streptomonospora litoralis]QBI56389.1 Nitrate/nitrite sensor protein NarX [Streptomonospora litoralis]